MIQDFMIDVYRNEDDVPFVNLMQLEVAFRESSVQYREEGSLEAAYVMEKWADAFVPLYGPVPEDV